MFCQEKRIGSITSYKKLNGGIEGKTAMVIFDVHVYNENIIRIRATKNKSFNTVNYALADNNIPPFNAAKINDDGNSIRITTNNISCIVQKNPFEVSFKNKYGQNINADAFSPAFNGDKLTVYKQLQPNEKFVGLGEALGNLNRSGSIITLNNTDNYKYGDPRLPMYSSIPFYIGIQNNAVYGLFFNNTYKSQFNFASSTPFASVSFDGGDLDYFFFYDTTVSKIIEHYTSITGRIPLPPTWSLGYQQSRCSYYPQSKVEWIAETFREKQIPIDGMVLDADYQLNYQPFRTNKERFPDLPGLSSKLASWNIELTASVYPGVKIDSGYDSYTDGLQKDIFVKYNNGNLFKTEIAPLKVVLPDYTNPAARNWWIEKMKWMQTNGISGYWNDMNEPALSNSYLPENLLFDFDGKKSNTAEAKNIYGFQMARSSYEAGLKYLDNKRPFVLTRSGFSGVQRYSAMWSGDNTASNEGLLTSVLLNCQMGLSGVPFIGYDLGGYIGDGSKDLFKRWMEAGVFSPYMRNHKEFFATANEPWSYGEEAEAIAKNYIGFRYRLMPYIYSAFYEASQNGLPVARSLCINYPHDEKVYDNIYQYQFMFGDALLVAPVTSEEKIKKVYLPAGEWYNIFTDKKLNGNTEINIDVPSYKIPVFVKASSLIPMQGLVQSTKQLPSDTLMMHVFNGNEKDEFTCYEDEGDGFSYKEGNYCGRDIIFDPPKRQLLFEKQKGSFHSRFKKVQIVFHGFEDDFRSVKINGNVTQQLSDCQIKILDALENLSDIYDKDFYAQLKNAELITGQKTITVNYVPGTIIINW
ncbi:MAG TPA: glycoside hydrolase family 31 protein [Puia sp.]|nr:glycoside hydrolase family 31 protein [Puia sp.]